MRKMKKFQANQKEILCWCSYIVEFDKKTAEFTTEYKVGEKKAKGMIYDNLIKLLPPGTKRNTLLKQTQRARDICKLFEKIGFDKIKYITTYTANSIQNYSIVKFRPLLTISPKIPTSNYPMIRMTLLSISKISDDQTNALEVQTKNRDYKARITKTRLN
ncbi:hypothetical protein RhiirC2_316107 [Rhizophagus irregularis]|uniref:Uncharacterized protein n=1 Tax=Rhizophagus irregularis TaxID=588596 RepID=A0A2N1MAZ1_9GLOM|nr:hypothetical protein RhiirC2_316107 [Rhizophagus irregularis]